MSLLLTGGGRGSLLLALLMGAGGGAGVCGGVARLVPVATLRRTAWWRCSRSW